MGWRRFFHRTRADVDHAREFQSHVEIETDLNVARGMSPEEARRAAHLKFGNTTLVREEVYVRHFDVLIQDLRYGLRQLWRTPVFTAVAVLTLALGLGANTAIFSVTNAVMLRFLPVHDPERLVYLAATSSIGNQSGDGDTSLTEYMFEQFRAERRVFSDVVAFVPLSSNRVAVRHGTEPEEAWVDMVSGDFFSGLGVQASRGRVFTLEDESNHAPFAILSHDYWIRRFAGESAVLGQSIFVKGVPFTIVGVAAPNFTGVEHGKPSDIWIPLQNRPDLKPWGAPAEDPDDSLYGSSMTWWCLKVIGRLAPGVKPKQALAQLDPDFQRAAYAGTSGPRPNEQSPHLYFLPARGIEGLRDDYQRPLTVLMGMVGLVLVIACGNVAMLLAARNAARQREFSLRMALGGNRTRLFRQLLTESMVLVLAGGGLGWLFAMWATKALAGWSNIELSLEPDHTVLFFALGLSVLVGLVFGLAPLRRTVRIPIGLALKTSSATANRDRGGMLSGQVMVAVQLSLCLVLLVGAGLLVRTLRNLEKINLGIRTSGLLVFGVNPQQDVHSVAEAVRFYQTLLDRMRAVPGVESATVVQFRPGGGWSSNSDTYIDGEKPRGKISSGMQRNNVGPGYFHVLGIPVLLGRDFTDADTTAAPKVAIVNQTFADRYLPNQHPIGHQIASSRGRAAISYTIAGVVADSKYTSVRDNIKPTAYLPYTQISGIPTMNVELRTAGDPLAFLPAVHRAMREFAPDLPLLQPTTQKEQFENSLSQERLVARLSLFFGMLAALLVATGLYGTLAYSVSRRTTEVGVRMALGARRGQVLWMILRQSLVVSLAGMALGIPLAIAGTRLVSSMLYGLTATDPMTFAGALFGITLVVLAASLIPARRAASVDPIVALRDE